jgi:hypothetical protein
MERANRLLQSTGHESDDEDKSKADLDTHQSKYKTGKTTATVPKLPKTTTKKNNHKKGQNVIHEDADEMDGNIDSKGLEPTADDNAAFGMSIDREVVMSMKVVSGNKLYPKLLKGAKRTPRGYSKTERWDCPLAKAPGGRSFETDSNIFLQMITKDLELEVMRHE